PTLQAVSGEAPKVAYAIDHRQQFEFSSTGNVVVVLLDEAQGNIVADVLDEDPILKKAYADFHLFTDFLSNTKSTSLSVPMILTGRYYDNSVEFSKFLGGGLATNSIPRFFVQQGYAVDFYPTNDYFNDVYIDPSYLENFRERFFDLKFSAQLYDLGLFAL